MKYEFKNILKHSTVLLVENDERIVEKFSRLLSVYVSKVYEATNGEEALILYKKHNPSFIITDIEMPNMDGLEFLSILRKEKNNIPAIIISAYSNKEYLLNSIKLQVISYLIKPIVLDEFFESLEKIASILKDNMMISIIEVAENIFYDPVNKTVSTDNTVNRLSLYESKLFELLILNKGNIVTKDMVENKLYNYKEMSDTALKNIVYKLRKKLLKDIIISVDKLGYTIKKGFE